MAGKIWFGTRELMQWVEAPAVGVDSSSVGFATKSSYLNGGAYIRRSQTGHKEYSFNWNQTSRENVRIITDYADGMFGTGLIYWSDPFTMDANVLPSYWANPSMGCDDGPILSGDVRPALVPTGNSNPLAYPVKSALYTLVSGARTRDAYIPIPPGYTAWVGVHTTQTTATGTAAVSVIPATGPTTDGPAVPVTLAPITADTRVWSSFSSTDNIGITLRLTGVGTITLTGLMVQVLPTGYTPELGKFISGQGNSGCQFETLPNLVNYSAVLDKVGLTAKLTETGAWQ